MNAPHPTRLCTVITADASKVSGEDFFRMVMGKPPLTAEDRARREEEKRAYFEKVHADYLAETALIRERTERLREVLRKHGEMR